MKPSRCPPVRRLFHLHLGKGDPRGGPAAWLWALVASLAWLAVGGARAEQAEPSGVYRAEIEADWQRRLDQRAETIDEVLDRAERLARLHLGTLPAELESLRRRAGALRGAGPIGPDGARREPSPDWRAAWLEARWLARRAALSDPAMRFDRLLVVKRFCQETYPDVCLNHMPWVSRPGGDVCVVELSGAEGRPLARGLIAGRLGPGHVHGMDLSWDADRIVFGYAKARGEEPPAGWLDRRSNFELRRNEEPTHLFEMRADGSDLRQLTSGEWSDLDPTYLANGDIAFVSERCGYSLQCNEYDKDETSCNLYVMRGDGGGIRRLSASKDGDYLPHALADGTIGYTRWEYQERGWAHIQSIWTIRPDGTQADALYKQHMNDPWALEDVRSVPGSHRLVAIATGHHTLAAGPVVLVDPRHGVNNPSGLAIVTPGAPLPEGGMTGRPVPEGGVPTPSGHYMTPWPLSETAFLVSYSHGNPAYPARGCGSEIDPTGYAIYLIDVYGTRELIYRDEAISCFSPVPLRPRERPPILPDLTQGGKTYATLVVGDVARGLRGIAPGRVRYLRVGHRLPWPYDNTHGGQRYEPDAKGAPNWTPVCVIGTVPLEADGSACFRVPADTAVYFQLLDENHMELQRMRSFISLQPGEVRACVGCHESREEVFAPARFPMALATEPRVPAPPPWGRRPVSFLRDVQMVFDRHCVNCHGGLKPAGGLDFSGGLTERHNRAFDTIQAAGLVSRSNVNDDARITQPLAFGSHRSRLIEALRHGACGRRAKLGADDWLRLVTWIDGNATYHDGFINKRPATPPYDLVADRALADAIGEVHQRRCAACHAPADVTRLDWIDLRRPERSLFLRAPLAQAAGGDGRCATSSYASTDDADYRELLKRVGRAVDEAWRRPRRDLAAFAREEPAFVLFDVTLPPGGCPAR